MPLSSKRCPVCHGRLLILENGKLACPMGHPQK
jgi:hypothetical protein